jgi:hypothetical protein
MLTHHYARHVASLLTLSYIFTYSTAEAAEVPPSLLLQTNSLALGTRLRVVVNNAPASLIEAAKNRSKVLLFLESVALRGLCTESFAGSNPPVQTLEFTLVRDDQNRSNWTALLGSPRGWSRPVTLNVGTEGVGELVLSGGARPIVALQIIRKTDGLAGCILFLVLVVWLFFVARRTEIIRDNWDSPEKPNAYETRFWHFVPWGALLVTGVLTWFLANAIWLLISSAVLFLIGVIWAIPKPRAPLPPYSLARTQMLAWFFLVIGAFLFLWLVTGSSDMLNTTVLSLMGISVGTSLAAEVQDASKPTRREDLVEEQKKLVALPNPNQQQKGRLSEIEAELNKAPIRPESKHFLNDVLTDAKGISFARLQMLIWTIVLGLLFIHDVYTNLAMPEFNTTILALMGISSGTYLGFILKEPNSSKQ